MSERSPKNNGIRVVFGSPNSFFTGIEKEGQKFLDVLKEHGYNNLDCSRGYLESERVYGELKWYSQGFVMDTKILSILPGCHTSEKIHSSVEESLRLLQVPKVNILYLHHPDRQTPLEETLRAMNEIYKTGKYEYFGISNYSVDEVKEILHITDKNGWIRPSVYQGQYNAITRCGEDELLPLLKKERISFYAFSPSGGGFFSGEVLKVDQKDYSGRFFQSPTPRVGAIYKNMYYKDSLMKFLQDYLEFIKPFNVAPIEAALRWVVYHSSLSSEFGDAVVIGASTPLQLKQNLKFIEKGPLPFPIVEYLNGNWETIKADSPPYYDIPAKKGE